VDVGHDAYSFLFYKKEIYFFTEKNNLRFNQKLILMSSEYKKIELYLTDKMLHHLMI